MASISNAKLDITPHAAQGVARVLVTCDVHFTEQEVAVMNERPELVYFQLFGWLMGQDIGSKDTDDLIFSFPTKNFPDASPSEHEPVSIDVNLSHSLLNEDVLGTDELYAEFLLKGRFRFGESLTKVVTDTVKMEFG